MSEDRKYPRTAHLPTSPGATSDDKRMSGEAYRQLAEAGEYVVTEKMDGGNLTMTRSSFFARSLDSHSNPWDARAKGTWASVCYNIPEGWRVCGESLHARRAIAYENLPGAFLVFAVFDEDDNLVDWDTTVNLCQTLGLPLVPVLYRGPSFKEALEAWAGAHSEQTSEGFVLRYAGTVPPGMFTTLVGKYVRAGHVQQDATWRATNYPTNSIVS